MIETRDIGLPNGEKHCPRNKHGIKIARTIIGIVTAGVTFTGCDAIGGLSDTTPTPTTSSTKLPATTKASRTPTPTETRANQSPPNEQKCRELAEDSENLQHVEDKIATYAMRKIVADRQAPGGIVIVGCDTETLASVPFGNETYSGGREVTERTKYDISSATKPFTAIGIMKAAEDGLLNPSQPVGSILPAYTKGAKADITLTDLLQHRAGIVDGRYSEIRNGSADPDQIKQNIVNWPVEKEQIGTYEYSNVGYSVAGIAASKVLGQPLTDYISDTVFEPLDMSETTYKPQGDCAPTTSDYDSTTYECVLQDRLGRPMQGDTYHTGIFTTGHDMEIFMRELAKIQKDDSDVLSQSTLDAMIDRSSPGYGTGFRINNKNVDTVALLSKEMSSEAFGHTGWNGTMFTYDPETSLWTVFLSNATYKQNQNPMENRLDKFSEIRRGINDIAVDAWKSKE